MRKKWVWILAAVVVFLGIGAVKNSQDKKAAAEETRAVIEEPAQTAAPTARPAPTPTPAPLVTLAPAEAEEPAADRAAPAETTPEPTPAPQPEKDWVLNTNTGKFHIPSCSSVKDIKEGNRRDVHMTRDAVIAQGYQPCGKCHP